MSKLSVLNIKGEKVKDIKLNDNVLRFMFMEISKKVQTV